MLGSTDHMDVRELCLGVSTGLQHLTAQGLGHASGTLQLSKQASVASAGQSTALYAPLCEQMRCQGLHQMQILILMVDRWQP